MLLKQNVYAKRKVQIIFCEKVGNLDFNKNSPNWNEVLEAVAPIMQYNF